MLNERQKLADELFLSGQNIYVGGPGGVGKSHLISYWRDRNPDRTIFIAPTGISALNIGCSTAHSTFKLQPRLLTKNDHNRPSEKVHELFGKGSPVTTIVMDEISMYRSDLFKTIDMNLRKVKERNVPFGGLQVVVVGDFYQLCPVLTKTEKEAYNSIYDSLYCFGTESWSAANFNYIELTEAMRHSEEEYIFNLQNIRMKRPGYLESIKYFNKAGMANQERVYENDAIFLCATNASADVINVHNYELLDGDEIVHKAIKSGIFEGVPAPDELKLKPGVKLICTANDGVLRNGMIVYFTRMVGSKMEIVIEETGMTLLAGMFKWENMEYKLDDNKKLTHTPTGSYRQYPFKHGYGITVHKSQGCTLSQAMIDRYNGFFSHGQAYVGLSRIKKLEGFGLMQPLQNSDIIVDRDVQQFYANNCKGIGF